MSLLQTIIELFIFCIHHYCIFSIWCSWSTSCGKYQPKSFEIIGWLNRKIQFVVSLLLKNINETELELVIVTMNYSILKKKEKNAFARFFTQIITKKINKQNVFFNAMPFQLFFKCILCDYKHWSFVQNLITCYRNAETCFNPRLNKFS